MYSYDYGLLISFIRYDDKMLSNGVCKISSR